MCNGRGGSQILDRSSSLSPARILYLMKRMTLLFFDIITVYYSGKFPSLLVVSRFLSADLICLPCCNGASNRRQMRRFVGSRLEPRVSIRLHVTPGACIVLAVDHKRVLVLQNSMPCNGLLRFTRSIKSCHIPGAYSA